MDMLPAGRLPEAALDLPGALSGLDALGFALGLGVVLALLLVEAFAFAFALAIPSCCLAALASASALVRAFFESVRSHFAESQVLQDLDVLKKTKYTRSKQPIVQLLHVLGLCTGQLISFDMIGCVGWAFAKIKSNLACTSQTKKPIESNQAFCGVATFIIGG